MNLSQAFESMLNNIRKESPLIHHITNYVTANDSANAVLALGGSPVMADAEEEVEEMVAFASALVLNMGTLNSQRTHSILLAGKRANALGIPVILDPVGLGTTKLRQSLMAKILQEVSLTVIRGNLSEIMHLYDPSVVPRGVDSILSSGEGAEEIAKVLAQRHHCTVAITGEFDVVSNGRVTYRIGNGTSHLSKITGTGCMSSSLIGLCCASGAPPLHAALLGLSIMGISGEIAGEGLQPGEGLGSFKVRLFDAFSHFTIKDYLERGKIYEVQE